MERYVSKLTKEQIKGFVKSYDNSAERITVYDAQDWPLINDDTVAVEYKSKNNNDSCNLYLSSSSASVYYYKADVKENFTQEWREFLNGIFPTYQKDLRERLRYQLREGLKARKIEGYNEIENEISSLKTSNNGREF